MMAEAPITDEQIVIRLGELRRRMQGMGSATMNMAREMRREIVEELEDLAGEIAARALGK